MPPATLIDYFAFFIKGRAITPVKPSLNIRHRVNNFFNLDAPPFAINFDTDGILAAFI